MHYVIGDVHGCYDELMVLLSKIESQDEGAQFIFVGDLIDRGPKVWDVLTWAIEHISPDGKYQSVRGNHEQMVIEWFAEWCRWWAEGGFSSDERMPETHYDFTKWLDGMNLLDREKVVPYIDFFRSLPLKKEISVKTKEGKEVHYRIAHAWDVFEEDVNDEAREYSNIWSREGIRGNHETEDIIVHGHTPTVAFDYWGYDDTAMGMIGYRKNAINVDGGVVFADMFRHYPCMLCGICLETLEEFYHTSLEERMEELNEGFRTSEEIKEHVEIYKLRYMQVVNPYRKEMLGKLGIHVQQ